MSRSAGPSSGQAIVRRRVTGRAWDIRKGANMPQEQSRIWHPKIRDFIDDFHVGSVWPIVRVFVQIFDGLGRRANFNVQVASVPFKSLGL